MKKRASLAFKYLSEIIVSAIIIFIFVQAGKTFGNQESHFKAAVAKDIALTLDLAYSLNGDFEYFYPNSLTGLDIEIKENFVSVYNSNLGKLDPTAATHYFFGTHQNPSFLIKDKKFLKITKEKNEIQFEGTND